jgi:hypothetical protein
VPHLVELTDVRQVSAGGVLSNSGGPFCALRGDGSVWCWGASWRFGGPDVYTPTRVTTLPPAKQVSVGNYRSCAALVDGTVGCWTNGTDAVDRSIDVQTPDAGVDGIVDAGSGPYAGAASALTGVTRVITKRYMYMGLACAIRIDESAVCWGNPTGGGLLPTPANISAASVSARFLAGPIKELAFYNDYNAFEHVWDYALEPDGELRCLEGSNCVLPGLAATSSPVPDGGLYGSGVSEIVAGTLTICTRAGDGGAVTCGFDPLP